MLSTLYNICVETPIFPAVPELRNKRLWPNRSLEELSQTANNFGQQFLRSEKKSILPIKRSFCALSAKKNA
jgi:hypothetical protein